MGNAIYVLDADHRQRAQDLHRRPQRSRRRLADRLRLRRLHRPRLRRRSRRHRCTASTSRPRPRARRRRGRSTPSPTSPAAPAPAASSSSAPTSIVTRAFTALMLGSGDREKPLLVEHARPLLRAVRPQPRQGRDRRRHAVDVRRPRRRRHRPRTPAGRAATSSSSEGEKVVNAATSIGGVSFFGTNRPSSGAAAAPHLQRQPRRRQDLLDAALLRHADGEHARRRRPAADAGVRHRHHRQRRRARRRSCSSSAHPIRRTRASKGSRVNPVIKVPAQPHLLVPGGQPLIVASAARADSQIFTPRPSWTHGAPPPSLPLPAVGRRSDEMSKAMAIAATASAARRVRWVMIGMLMTLLAA